MSRADEDADAAEDHAMNDAAVCDLVANALDRKLDNDGKVDRLTASALRRLAVDMRDHGGAIGETPRSWDNDRQTIIALWIKHAARNTKGWAAVEAEQLWNVMLQISETVDRPTNAG